LYSFNRVPIIGITEVRGDSDFTSRLQIFSCCWNQHLTKGEKWDVTADIDDNINEKYTVLNIATVVMPKRGQNSDGSKTIN
jgi:hypothetical protein